MIMNMVPKPITIDPTEVMNGKVVNTPYGQVVGAAPFEYIDTDNGIDNYRVLEDQIYIVLPNGLRKLLDVSSDIFTLTDIT